MPRRKNPETGTYPHPQLPVAPQNYSLTLSLGLARARSGIFGGSRRIGDQVPSRAEAGQGPKKTTEALEWVRGTGARRRKEEDATLLGPGPARQESWGSGQMPVLGPSFPWHPGQIWGEVSLFRWDPDPEEFQVGPNQAAGKNLALLGGPLPHLGPPASSWVPGKGEKG